jgi:Tol biopolymer transport system component/uncharacterized protein YjdB
MSRKNRLFGAAAAAAALWLLTACSDSSTTRTPTVALVKVAPTDPTMTVGENLTLSAQALDESGSILEGRQVSWSSSSTLVATVSSGGIVTAVDPGTVVIRATVGDRFGEATLVVHPVPVARVLIDRTSLAVDVGQSVTLVARSLDAADNELQNRAVAWTSSDPSIAEVDAVGRVVGKRAGAATVTATVENKAAEIPVTVSLARVPVASISVSPAPVVLDVGKTRQLAVTVLDAGGNELTDRAVTWTTDSPFVAEVKNGLVSAVGPGYATIVATSEGKTFGVAVTVSQDESDVMPQDLVYHQTSGGSIGEIFILATAAGSTPARVNAGNVSRSPSASPGGNRIAFYVAQNELNGDRTDDIFAVDRDGLNMKQLTKEPGYDGDPAWSPVADRIAYRRIEPGTGRGDVWVMNADGSQKVKLTGDLAATQSAGAPAWSADGSRIAFITTSYGQNNSSSTLWIMNADGSNKRSLVVNSTAGDRDPTWSADGSRIAFIRSYRDDTDITVVDVNTGDLARMALPGQQEAPAWSPDGRHIAYWRHVGPTADAAIYTVRADGTNVRLHTRLPAWAGGYDPAWIKR